MFMFI